MYKGFVQKDQEQIYMSTKLLQNKQGILYPKTKDVYVHSF